MDGGIDTRYSVSKPEKHLLEEAWHKKVHVFYGGLHLYVMSRMDKPVQPWSTLVGVREHRCQE
jgi:hypothetical protein